MPGDLVTGVAINLVAGKIRRAGGAARDRLRQVNQSADFSTDLDAIETEFQRALVSSLDDLPDDDRFDALRDAAESWDPVVHELYGLEGSAPDVESMLAGEHDRLLFGSEREAIDSIIEAWTTVAGVDLADEPELEQDLRRVVASAYRDAITEFIDRISGTELADVFKLEALREVQQTLLRIDRENRRSKIYKSIAEFKRKFLREQPYVPVPAELETEERSVGLGSETETESVEDAKETALSLLRDGVDAIHVFGDGGAGKSQLLASLGEELQSEREVYYVTDPVDEYPPPLSDDAVLFVDDAGRKDMSYFIRLAEESNRITANQQYDVQVVTAERSVYKQSVGKLLREYVGLRTPTLRLQSMDEEGLRELLADFGIGEEAVEWIAGHARGNPFFATLLGKLVLEGGDVQSDMTKAFENVVAEMVETDIEAFDSSDQSVRRFLDALSIWSEYEEPEDAEVLAGVVGSLRDGIDRGKMLDELVETNYVEYAGDDEFGREGSYSFRYDVVADYLRFESVAAGARYRDFVGRGVVEAKAPGVVRGLLDLVSSPVRPFYSEKEIEQALEHLDWLAEKTFEYDLSTPALLEAQSLIAFVRPRMLNHEELLERGSEYESKEELLVPVALLVQVSSDRAEDNLEWTERFFQYLDLLGDVQNATDEATAPLAGGLVNAINYYGEAGKLKNVETRLEQLDRLADDHDDPAIRTELAKGLFNAINHYGEASKLKNVETRLEQLETLADDHDNPAIRTNLAEGLFNAIYYYGEAEDFEKVETGLEQLNTLANDHGNPAIRTELARGLVNAIKYYGEAEKFEKAETRLEQLDRLADDHDDPAIRTELAEGLFNAIYYYGGAGNLEEVEKQLEKLDTLADNSDDSAIRERLAEGLVNAIKNYGEAGKFEKAETLLEDLESLTDDQDDPAIRTELARGLVNAIANYGEAGNLEEIEMRLEQLEKLADDHDDPAIRERLARGLVNAIKYYGEAEKFDKIETRLEQLEKLADGSDDSAIRKILTKGLQNSNKIYIENPNGDRLTYTLSKLNVMASKYGDFGGLESNAQFIRIATNQIVKILDIDTELSIEYLEILEPVVPTNSWTTICGEVFPEVEQRFEDGEITKDQYLRFADLLQ
jgi:cell fate (sporulation/competence/biofilm development) regulator YmcA (YheA/YmcA/DUF963 family)